MTKLIVFLFLCIVLQTDVFAASFDCSKASSKVEKIICSDAELSSLDEKMQKVYKAKLENSINKYGIRAMQRDWLKIMRKNCSDSACIKQNYEAQIATLEASSEEVFSANYKTNIENILTVKQPNSKNFAFSLQAIDIDDGKTLCEVKDLKADFENAGTAKYSNEGCIIKFEIDSGEKSKQAGIKVSSENCEKLCPSGLVFDESYAPSSEPVAGNQ